MTIQIFVCDTAAGLITTLAEIDGYSEVLYRTRGASGESGEIVRFLVRPPRSPGETFESYQGKFIVVAVIDE